MDYTLRKSHEGFRGYLLRVLSNNKEVAFDHQVLKDTIPLFNPQEQQLNGVSVQLTRKICMHKGNYTLHSSNNEPSLDIIPKGPIVFPNS